MHVTSGDLIILLFKLGAVFLKARSIQATVNDFYNSRLRHAHIFRGFDSSEPICSLRTCHQSIHARQVWKELCLLSSGFVKKNVLIFCKGFDKPSSVNHNDILKVLTNSWRTFSGSASVLCTVDFIAGWNSFVRASRNFVAHSYLAVDLASKFSLPCHSLKFWHKRGKERARSSAERVTSA